MALKDEEDSRPVITGDLVAAQWYPDEEYYIGEVDFDQTIRNYGGRGDADNAYHLVKLMDAEAWNKLAGEASQGMFNPVVKAFPMVKSGDYAPLDTLKPENDIKAAIVLWLHWNYPKT